MARSCAFHDSDGSGHTRPPHGKWRMQADCVEAMMTGTHEVGRPLIGARHFACEEGLIGQTAPPPGRQGGRKCGACHFTPYEVRFHGAALAKKSTFVSRQGQKYK